MLLSGATELAMQTSYQGELSSQVIRTHERLLKQPCWILFTNFFLSPALRCCKNQRRLPQFSLRKYRALARQNSVSAGWVLCVPCLLLLKTAHDETSATASWRKNVWKVMLHLTCFISKLSLNF